MFVTNYRKVASTEERKDALEIVEAGIKASLPEEILKNKLKLKNNVLVVDKKKIDLSQFNNIYVVGGGKASYLTAKYIDGLLGDRIRDGVVIDVKVKKLKHIRCYEGTHPYPSQKNIVATNEIISLLKKTKKDDLIITIVTGGGSSLIFNPHKLTHVKVKAITEAFFKKGANIKEMNIVRKHISDIHGGNIAKLAYPATVLGLIFSDVPFGDPSFVASGPTYLDKTTKSHAKKVADKYGIKNLPLIETTKDKKYFKKVTNVLMLSNKDALSAMKRRAEEKGYKTRICEESFQGEASKLTKKLFTKCKMTSNKFALIAGGETIVRLKEKGKGGRNLEVAMGALDILPDKTIVVSMASDGKDNVEGVGGGIADRLVCETAKKRGYSSQEFLDKNISYNFMKDTNGLIESKKTGTNVADLVVILKRS
jgi:glycerate-2-kinase